MKSILRAHSRALFSDKGALLVLLVAPILYAFFYPLPYKAEQMYDLPFGVIDFDRSASSRDLVRLWESNPQLQIQTFVDSGDAMQAMAEGSIIGWAAIPEGWQRSLYHMEDAVLQIGTSGVNVLASSQLLTALQSSTQEFNQRVKVERLSALGLSANTIATAGQPVILSSVPMFNPSQGYGSYIVPAVLVMIIQQSLWIGQALVLGRRAEQGPLWQNWLEVAVDWLFFSLIALWNCLFAFLWILNWQGYPAIGQWLPLLAFSGLFSASIAAFGLLLSSFYSYREQGMQWLLALAVPLFFISGYPLPVEALPDLVQQVRWLIPSTAGIAGFMAINQMGAGFGSLSEPFMWLGILTVLSLLCINVRLVWSKKLDDSNCSVSDPAQTKSH